MIDYKDDEEEDMKVLQGSEWAFVWACITIAAIGFLSLCGVAWRAWPWW